MYDNLEYLMSLPEDSLLEMLVPPDERHSPDSDIPRGQFIFKQCIIRSKEALLSFYNEHNKAVDFTLEAIVALLPIVVTSVPESMAGVVSVLIVKYGIKNVLAIC